MADASGGVGARARTRRRGRDDHCAEPSARERSCVEFRVLGPLEIAVRDASLTIGSPRQQTILAMLLLDANRAVPVERLIDAAWPYGPPATARSQVQICVCALRKRLAAASIRDVLVTVPGGYVARVDDEQLDLRIFEHRVAVGRAAMDRDRAEGVRWLRSALDVWRGPALEGLESPMLRRVATGLDESRMAVLQEAIEAELALGRHRQVISELRDLVRAHPLREDLRGYLMRALYRSGRRVEALEVYRTARVELVEQLGLEPGDALKDLERAILSGAPA